MLKIERRDTKIAKYWARIPVKGRRGGVWVAIKPHRPIEPDMEICESKLFKKGGEVACRCKTPSQKVENLPT